ASSPQEGGTPLPLRLRRVRSDGAGVRFGRSQTRWARPVRGVALGARLPSVVRLTQRLQVGVTVVVRITNVVDLVGGLAAHAAVGDGEGECARPARGPGGRRPVGRGRCAALPSAGNYRGWGVSHGASRLASRGSGGSPTWSTWLAGLPQMPPTAMRHWQTWR